ncbi:hypothetical protein BJX99DRAFT_219321 [Aspergillus californicus]
MDCYEILGISPDATDKDINTAYRGLALKHHPDKTGAEDDAIEFQKVCNPMLFLLYIHGVTSPRSDQSSRRNPPRFKSPQRA